MVLPDYLYASLQIRHPGFLLYYKHKPDDPSAKPKG